MGGVDRGVSLCTLLSSDMMRCLAWGEVSLKCSSGRAKSECKMCLHVSSLLSSPSKNGLSPVSNTYSTQPKLLQNKKHNSKLH